MRAVAHPGRVRGRRAVRGRAGEPRDRRPVGRDPLARLGQELPGGQWTEARVREVCRVGARHHLHRRAARRRDHGLQLARLPARDFGGALERPWAKDVTERAVYDPVFERSSGPPAATTAPELLRAHRFVLTFGLLRQCSVPVG